MWEAPASLERCIEVILRIELKQSYCENLESVPAVFAKLSWNFHLSLCGCSALAGNQQYIACLSIHYWDMTCFDGLNLKKSCAACSILRQNIDVSFGPNGASARRILLLLASFNVALPSERENPSWIDWTIEISPSIRWVLLGWFSARVSRFRVSHHAAYCARRSLTSYRPVMHMCSHFGARVRRRIAAATRSAGPRARRRRSLNILTARKPMCLSSRHWLILLASHRMALTRERKNSS